MNPGYNPINYETICNNAKLLNVPITVFETEILDTLAKITDRKRSNQPFSGKDPLDVIKQLVFILRTFNTKQVDAKWKQFMASMATGRVSSPAEALGPHLLQDPPLAQH